MWVHPPHVSGVARLHCGAQKLILRGAQEGRDGISLVAPPRIVVAAEQPEESVHLAAPPPPQRLLGVIALVARLRALPDTPLLQPQHSLVRRARLGQPALRGVPRGCHDEQLGQLKLGELPRHGWCGAERWRVCGLRGGGCVG